MKKINLLILLMVSMFSTAAFCGLYDSKQITPAQKEQIRKEVRKEIKESQGKKWTVGDELGGGQKRINLND